MVGCTISLVCALVLIGKSLGGFRFVAVSLCSFCSSLNFLMGMAILTIGYSLHADAGSTLAAVDGHGGAVGSVSDAAQDDLASFDEMRMKELTLLSTVCCCAPCH